MKFFNRVGEYCYRPYRQLPYVRVFYNQYSLGITPKLITGWHSGSQELLVRKPTWIEWKEKIAELNFYVTFLQFTFMFQGWYK